MVYCVIQNYGIPAHSRLSKADFQKVPILDWIINFPFRLE